MSARCSGVGRGSWASPIRGLLRRGPAQRLQEAVGEAVIHRPGKRERGAERRARPGIRNRGLEKPCVVDDPAARQIALARRPLAPDGERPGARRGQAAAAD